ncbi:MAG: DNA polymerase III subunit gamma/tau C-terminal domain-containing protein [Halioglobus sp.]|nr:DNA polymerase III subunit gamma/tau C-terminal domain-containing protein [Halioglobus sp.]
MENTSPASATPESASPEPETDEPGNAESTPALDDLTPDTWPDLLERLDLAGIVHNIGSNCVLDRRVENTLYFLLDPDNASLFNEAHREKIHHALERYFGRELSVVIETGAFSGESPAMRRARRCEERRRAAVAAIEEDPHVQALITHFDGELDRSSILPLDN